MPVAAALVAMLLGSAPLAAGLREDARGSGRLRAGAWRHLASRGLDDVVATLRQEQADLLSKTEDWVSTAVAFEQEWGTSVAQKMKELLGSVTSEKQNQVNLQHKAKKLCPLSCQRDAMQFATFDASPQNNDIKVAQANAKIRLTKLQGEVTDAKVLQERLGKYYAETTRVKFEVEKDVKAFEASLATVVEPHDKEASLLSSKWGPFKKLWGAIKKAVKKVVHIVKKVFKDHRPTVHQLARPYQLKRERVNMERGHCDTMKSFHSSVKAQRATMSSKVDAERGRLQGNIAHIGDKDAKVSAKTDAFKQLQLGFASICQKELDNYIANQDLFSDLEPKESKELLVSEVDAHHLRWKSTCDDMKSLAEGITGWVKLCKAKWQSSTLGYQEDLQALGGMPTLPPIDGLTSAVNSACSKDFNAAIADAQRKEAEIRNYCSSKITDGNLLRRFGGWLGARNCKK